MLTAAQRRLREEMGIGVVLEEAAWFAYRASDAVSGFTEHEYDYVLVGRFDGSSDPTLRRWRTGSGSGWKPCDSTSVPTRRATRRGGLARWRRWTNVRDRLA